MLFSVGNKKKVMNKIERLLNKEFSGNVFATLITETKPKVRPGSPVVIKRTIVNGALNFDYQRAFIKRTGQQAPGNKPWFSQPSIEENGKMKRIPIVFKGEKKYIRIMVIRSKAKFFQGRKKLSTLEVNSYVQPSAENPTNIRVYSLENVKAIRLHGQEIKA